MNTCKQCRFFAPELPAANEINPQIMGECYFNPPNVIPVQTQEQFSGKPTMGFLNVRPKLHEDTMQCGRALPILS